MTNSDTEEATPLYRAAEGHRLESPEEGESEVEKQAFKIEKRRENRTPITFFVRLMLLQECKDIAKEKGYTGKKISKKDLVLLRDKYARKAVEQDKHPWTPWIMSLFGMKTHDHSMLEILEKAVNYTVALDDWFHYVEYTFYHTVIVSKFPWMRNESANAMFVVILFFLCTPLFFCYVLDDESICRRSNEISWLNGCYMASVTMSTVGYGDMTVDRENINFGTLYMIISICVSILAFSAAAGDAFSPFERYFQFDTKNVAEDQVLSVRLAAIKLVKLGEIVTHFVVLNLFGVIVSRFFSDNLSSVHQGSQWTWSESIYWSVQSTTTVGYGDMIMSDGMRLFQVFYLTLGTFFVGNTLGKLSNLKRDMEDMRRLYAWNERQVSKEMIRLDQADDRDPNVDQYEFVVASLLNLNKISASDIKPIMNKFRRLAVQHGDTGYICLDEDNVEGDKDQDSGYDSL